MLCRQCEQTQNNTGCTTTGVCGKTSETAAVQDALIEQIKAVSLCAVAAGEAGIAIPEAINAWTLQAAFSTLTNVNFSEERICEYIREGNRHQMTLQYLLKNDSVVSLDLSGMSDSELETFGYTVGILKRQEQMGNEDCFSLNEIGTYGLKGRSRYDRSILSASSAVGSSTHITVIPITHIMCRCKCLCRSLLQSGTHGRGYHGKYT